MSTPNLPSGFPPFMWPLSSRAPFPAPHVSCSLYALLQWLTLSCSLNTSSPMIITKFTSPVLISQQSLWLIYSKSSLGFFKGFSIIIYPWLIFCLFLWPNLILSKWQFTHPIAQGINLGICLSHSVRHLTSKYGKSYWLKVFVQYKWQTWTLVTTSMALNCQGPLSGSL